MKNILLGATTLVLLAACHGGQQTRTPEQWQSEVGKEIESRLPQLRACYAHEAGSTVTLLITAWPNDTQGAYDYAGQTLWVEHDGVLGHAEPPVLASCVTKALHGLPLPPKDANVGNGKWKLTFKAT